MMTDIRNQEIMAALRYLKQVVASQGQIFDKIIDYYKHAMPRRVHHI